MTWFTVRLTAQADHLPDDVHLEKLGEALQDCRGDVSLDPLMAQWRVDLTVYELTIVGAAMEAVQLVVEAASSVDMPPSDITEFEVKAPGQRYRTHLGGPGDRPPHGPDESSGPH